MRYGKINFQVNFPYIEQPTIPEVTDRAHLSFTRTDGDLAGNAEQFPVRRLHERDLLRKKGGEAANLHPTNLSVKPNPVELQTVE